MTAKQTSLEDLFLQDDFTSLLLRTLDANPPNFTAKDLPYILASLSFMGRIEEAEFLFQHHVSDLDLEARICSRFYLAIAATRQQDDRKARELLWMNAKEGKQTQSALSRFYLFQGLAFYRYTYGHFSKAKRLVQRAQSFALLSSKLHARILAEDLRAHIEFQLGEVRQGIWRLEKLCELAKTHALKGPREWASISLMLYKAQHGLLGSEAIPNLLEWRESARGLDTYNEAQILIEISAQSMYRGELTKAEDALENATQLVLQTGNPRLEALLYLRYALLERMRASPLEALAYVQRAAERLGRFVDLRLEAKILGFQRDLTRSLDPSLPRKAKESPSSKGFVSERIESRRIGGNVQTLGQDPFGDFLDSLEASSKASLRILLKQGWTGFLFDWAKLPRNGAFLYLDIDGKGSLSCLDHGEVEHSPKALTPLLRKLFSALALGPKTKEELLKSVWGYETYHPDRHNHLIYNLLATARKSLGSRGEWIVSKDEGYALDENVSMQMRTPEIKDHVSRISQSLENLASGSRFGMNDYRKSLGVSEATAVRDLRKLVEDGRLTRSGKGRSTEYCVI